MFMNRIIERLVAVGGVTGSDAYRPEVKKDSLKVNSSSFKRTKIASLDRSCATHSAHARSTMRIRDPLCACAIHSAHAGEKIRFEEKEF